VTDDDRPLDPRGRRVPRAALAPNWWVVLLADAAVGVVVALVGVALAVWWLPWLGALVMAAGVVYVALVVRRGLQWRWLRREAGRS